MHLKIKPVNDTVKGFYENHANFHEGESGLDLFVTEKIIVPGKVLGFKIDLGISCEAFEDKKKNNLFLINFIQDRQWGPKHP